MIGDLQRAITPYIDGNELVSPNLVPPGVKRASDNGVLHASRYLILQSYLGQPFDQQCYLGVLACVDGEGYVHRAPDDPAIGDDPDDLYGIISMFAVLGASKKITLPWKLMHPMLVYMRGLQRGNPLVRLLSLPAAILIALSNFEPASETTNRLLTWNIIQGTKGSLLCRLAAKIWYARQNVIYGGNSINKIAAIYYPNNPMKNYWRE